MLHWRGGEEFTVIDMSAAYNQFELADESKKILALSTPVGSYIVNRLPFGTKPACALFQEKMENVLLGLKGVKNFFDGIIVTGRDSKEHLENLRLVLQRLLEHGLKLNREKCKFFQQRVEYLGHIIDKFGVHKSPKKIQAILDAREPENVAEVQAFIGMVNYYSKFMPDLATAMHPLYKLLKKGQRFLWTEDCRIAFALIKKEIASDRNLAHYNGQLPVKLSCDASNVGVGAVLLHVYPDGKERPICFASKSLNNAQKNYSATQKEAYAIFWACRKFYYYLIKPLLALFGEKSGIPCMAAGRLQRWALFLSGFDYSIQYVKGKNNGAADGLSRLPGEDPSPEENESDYLNFLVEDKLPVNAAKIRKKTRVDPELSKVFYYTREGWPTQGIDESLKPYSIRSHEIGIDEGLLLWGYRVIIPQKYRKELIEEIHATHMGSTKMKSLARQYFWWPNLDKDLENCSKNCIPCNTFSQNPPRANLIKYPQAKEVGERVHVDFLGPLNSKFDFIIMDSFSKWPEVYEMPSINAEATVSKVKDYCSRYRLPKLIISDNGRQLVSKEFEHFCLVNEIKHKLSATYHPSTNGAAENAVKSFKTGLKKALIDPRNSSVKIEVLISRYLFAYRNSPHCLTGETPSKLMFNRKLQTRFDLLRDNLAEKNAARQVETYGGSRGISFDVSEKVWIKDYKIPSKPIWSRATISRVLGQRNYECVMELGGDIHERHVDQMRPRGFRFDKDFDILSKSDKAIIVSKESEVVINDGIIDVSDERVSEECVNNSKNIAKETQRNDSMLRRSLRTVKKKTKMNL